MLYCLFSSATAMNRKCFLLPAILGQTLKEKNMVAEDRFIFLC